MFMIGVSANAGMWSVIESSGMKVQKPQAEWELDTAGWAPRVYEFTTLVAPKQKCVIVFSASNENSSPAMSCTDIKGK